MQQNKRIELRSFLIVTLLGFTGTVLVSRVLAVLQVFPAIRVAEIVVAALAYICTFVFAAVAIKYSQYAKKFETVNPQLSKALKKRENQMYWAVFISFLVWCCVLLSFAKFA